MTSTEDYIVFDRTGTPHVAVAIKTEIGNRGHMGRMKTSESCPECGTKLKLESDENSCCWCCLNCCYSRVERELPEVEDAN